MEDPRLKKIPESQPCSDNEDSTMTEELEKRQDFSQQTEKNIVNRHKIKYTATRIKCSAKRIKSRNFLSNISYTGINKSDFYNESFILDVYVLLVKNLNPFSLQRKISDKLKHEMVYMLWRECVPPEFYRYICKDEKFKYLNGRYVSQPGVFEIVGNFIGQGKENLRMFQKNFANYKDIFQYVYSHVFPEIYATSEKRGIDLKTSFHIMFKTCRDKMIMRQQALAKQTINYESEQQEKCEFEQKPVKNFDDFSNGEEEDIKKCAEKRNAMRCEKAEELKAKKLKVKEEENKAKEGQLWNRLAELNGEFKKIKQSKRDIKKMSATVLQIVVIFLFFFNFIIVKFYLNQINAIYQKMSDSGFFLLPTNKLYKKENT